MRWIICKASSQCYPKCRCYSSHLEKGLFSITLIIFFFFGIQEWQWIVHRPTSTPSFRWIGLYALSKPIANVNFYNIHLRLNKYFSQGYIPLWWRKHSVGLFGSRYTDICESFKIGFSCNAENERKFCLAVTWSTGSTPERMAFAFFLLFFYISSLVMWLFYFLFSLIWNSN